MSFSKCFKFVKDVASPASVCCSFHKFVSSVSTFTELMDNTKIVIIIQTDPIYHFGNILKYPVTLLDCISLKGEEMGRYVALPPILAFIKGFWCRHKQAA